MTDIDAWYLARRLVDAAWKPTASEACVVNAICSAARHTQRISIDMLIVFRKAAVLRAAMDIPAWNDAPGLTKVEVLAVFDRIITDLETLRHGE